MLRGTQVHARTGRVKAQAKMMEKVKKRSYQAWTIFLVVMATFSSPAFGGSQRGSRPQVNIASGRIQGVARNGLMIFKGIPYAQPPVGPLRWRPPQPVKPWTHIRSARHFGSDCMQLPDTGVTAPLRTTPSEDCLYLNVWAPQRRARQLRPVMVWIYGGGFVNGGSSPAVYSGSRFARLGVVFVSFNYRLGRFGFFAFPALTRQGGLLGNYALMDQLAALRWVQRNIAAFGGDPHQVTIFGESAGGLAVNVLLTSPLGRGLFARAIIESGGGRSGPFPPPPLAHPGLRGQPSAEQRGIDFARQMGIQGTGPAALSALRLLSAKEIANGLHMSTVYQQQATYAGATQDGQVIAQLPEQVYKEGKQARVPVLVGATSADVSFTRAHTLDELFALFGPEAAAARRTFDRGNHGNFKSVAERVGAIQVMIEPARFVARRFASAGQPAYQYRFSYVAAPLRGRFTGAPHTSEIPYVFHTLRKSPWGDFGKNLTPQDLRMARLVNAYWVNFAKTGNPNAPGLPHWPRLTPGGDQLMNFTQQGPRAETDPWKAQLDLVERIQP